MQWSAYSQEQDAKLCSSLTPFVGDCPQEHPWYRRYAANFSPLSRKPTFYSPLTKIAFAASLGATDPARGCRMGHRCTIHHLISHYRPIPATSDPCCKADTWLALLQYGGGEGDSFVREIQTKERRCIALRNGWKEGRRPVLGLPCERAGRFHNWSWSMSREPATAGTPSAPQARETPAHHKTKLSALQ